jgi:hypothetical protein
VKDWAGVMISAQTLTGRILVVLVFLLRQLVIMISIAFIFFFLFTGSYNQHQTVSAL